MAYTIVKALLLAVAAGSSVQGFSFGSSSSSSSSFSASSSSSSSLFSSGSLMQELSGFSGITSLSASTQKSICDTISKESATGTINFVDVIGSCGSVCIQNAQTKNDLISFLMAAQQKTNAVQIVLDADYYRAFRQLDISSVIAQNNARFLNNYGFCVKGIESILAKYIRAASSRSSITIDINEFRGIFGEYFVKATVAELQAIIRALFQQVGCYSNIVFTQPRYYQVDVSAFLELQKSFAESLKLQVQSMNEIDISSISALIGQAKTRYSGCRVCLSEADALSSRVYGLVQKQSSASDIKAQISSAMNSFESSSSFAFSSSSSSSSSFSSAMF